ncbi:MAG: PQQ-dependent sugar dehydrogenase [Paludibacter sp.]|nr:PQQ-dependent sugar dehydrogenase [Paludibacter sp.]
MKTLYRLLVISFLLIQLEAVSCREMQNMVIPAPVVFANGLITPVCIAHAGDSRLFVVNQHGLIMLVDSAGRVYPTPFMDISSRVTYGGERGLLGIAFHPHYKTNGYFYVNYVGVGDSTHISRFNVSTSDPNKADPLSEVKLLTLFQPYVNHNGGDLCFGPDGYLYIGLGDGGSGGDPGNRAQNLTENLGKILRIDVDHGNPYAIPVTNPFYNSTTARKEIWGYGLRNPWRISFDRLTSDLWIADVGQNLYEEINFQPASSTGGENYGWRCYEGNMPYDTVGCNSASSYTFPAYAYPHGPECSVIGGYVDRSSPLSPTYGHYFFADFCSDKIWTLHQVAGNWVVQDYGQYTGNNFSTFGEDYLGQLYVAGLTSGIIFRISSNTTGITEHQNTPNLKVIYLPGNGMVRVETDRNDGAEMQLTVFDTMGVSFLKVATHQSNFNIDISSLPKGIYFLNIVLDGRNQVHKLIKS